MVFNFFPAWLFEGYDGCERGDETCGWCGDLGWCDGFGVVEVFYSVAMGVGVGGVGNRGRSVWSGGGDASVADGGADGGGARWRDCCSLSDGIFGELREHLPYRLPFTFIVIDFFS